MYFIGITIIICVLAKSNSFGWSLTYWGGRGERWRDYSYKRVFKLIGLTNNLFCDYQVSQWKNDKLWQGPGGISQGGECQEMLVDIFVNLTVVVIYIWCFLHSRMTPAPPWQWLMSLFLTVVTSPSCPLIS